ncbi:MAG: trigger factor [Firmicutes bacterium]|nr:trigger factor [Bacillota bacterium]
MQFNLEKLDKNFVALTVTVSLEEVEKALAKSYKTVVNKINLPGFRKGHIPRLILEKQFGKEILYEDAVKILVQDGYLAGIKEYDLHPIAQPKFEPVNQFEEGSPFIFKMEIEVLPEVKLGQYKGLTVEKVQKKVTEEDVDLKLKELQERHAELVLSDHTQLAQGDFAVIDYEGYVQGQAFSGGAAQSYTLEIGAGNFIAGFEDQLLGMEIGTERVISVVFPEDYYNQDLAGKKAEFKVKLKEIKVKEYPALDDEFAKSLGKFETLQELRDDLYEKIRKSSEREAELMFGNNAVKVAVDNAEVEIPESMIEQETGEMMRRFEQNLSYRGLSFDQYASYSKKTREEIEQDFRPEAFQRVKTDLVLSKIAKVEDIKITDEELNMKISELAGLYGAKDPAKFRRDLEKRGRLDAIEQSILMEKTTDFLREQSVARLVER